MKIPAAAALINSSAVAFGGTVNVAVKPLKTRGSEYPLCDNQLLTVLSVTEMYAPVYPPSVVASVSYCALPLCLLAFGGDTLFKCYFYPNTKRGLARDGTTCAGALCRAASAMFRRKMRSRVMFINTWRRLSGMTLISLCQAFHNHWEAQQSPWSDGKANQSPFS